MGNLGTFEILMILLVVLLVFGAKRLPEIGSSIGKGIREFKRSISEVDTAVNSSIAAPPQSQSQPLPGRQFDAPDAASTQPTGEPRRLSQ
jgi:sec-independent protein translocase protein TatA